MNSKSRITIFCLTFLPSVVWGAYQRIDLVLQSGYQTARGVIQGNISEVGFRQKAIFNMALLHIAYNRWDLFGGITYLFLNSQVNGLFESQKQGFADPFFGGQYYFLYENYYFPQVAIESEIIPPWGESFFSTQNYLNRNRLLLQKSFRHFRLSTSLGYLYSFSKNLRDGVFLASSQIFSPLRQNFVLGAFINYQNQTLLEKNPFWQTGGFISFWLYSLEWQLFAGHEMFFRSGGWFFGIGLSGALYETR